MPEPEGADHQVVEESVIRVSEGSLRTGVFPAQRSPLPASSSRGGVHLAPGEMRLSRYLAALSDAPAGAECAARFPDGVHK